MQDTEWHIQTYKPRDSHKERTRLFPRYDLNVSPYSSFGFYKLDNLPRLTG